MPQLGEICHRWTLEHRVLYEWHSAMSGHKGRKMWHSEHCNTEPILVTQCSIRSQKGRNMWHSEHCHTTSYMIDIVQYKVTKRGSNSSKIWTHRVLYDGHSLLSIIMKGRNMWHFTNVICDRQRIFAPFVLLLKGSSKLSSDYHIGRLYLGKECNMTIEVLRLTLGRNQSFASFGSLARRLLKHSGHCGTPADLGKESEFCFVRIFSKTIIEAFRP